VEEPGDCTEAGRTGEQPNGTDRRYICDVDRSDHAVPPSVVLWSILSGTPTRRQPRNASRAQLRAAIEDAAARLFAADGYEATTVDDIVDAAAVSKPALYRFFESKQHLYMTLLERHRDELAAAALAQVAGDEPPDRWLPKMVDAWFRYVEAHPFTSCMFRDDSGDPDVQALRTELQRRQRAADVALLRQFVPELDEPELEPLGEAIRASLYGLALWWANHPDTPRATLVSTMVRIVTGIMLSAHQGKQPPARA
jgi:AcrR family transcriptional regulator